MPPLKCAAPGRGLVCPALEQPLPPAKSGLRLQTGSYNKYVLGVSQALSLLKSWCSTSPHDIRVAGIARVNATPLGIIALN
ncbi:hypothetical protein TNCV_1693111 [Trichonephila clavipes]|nr:hypothetical protein TNCV_1693111 [Trichonephila clavipes]